MWSSHPSFEIPADNTVLWNFMSTEKFLSLITSCQLNLARVDQFDDPWEGSITQGTADAINANWGVAAPQSLDLLKQSLARFRKRAFASCWHMNDHESAAMWDLYARRNAGVAIRTSIKSLKNSLVCTEELFVGRVNYKDYSAHVVDMNMYSHILLKRKSFEHEQELRIIYFEPQVSGTPVLAESASRFKRIPVQLDVLLERVSIAPMAPAWHLTAIRDAAVALRLPPELFTQSNLYNPSVV